MADWHALDRRARRQLGLFTTADAAAAGFSASTLTRLRERGTIVRLYRGVYAIAGSPDSWERRLLAAHLRANGSVVSHACAAYLDGIAAERPTSVELTVPRSSTLELPGVVLHHPTDAVGDDTIWRGPFRCTTTLRTIRDVAATRCVEDLIDAALRTGRLRHADLETWLAAAAPAPGVGRVRAAAATASPALARARSPYESIAYRLLVRAGIPPEVNWPVLGASGQRYLLDIAYPPLLVAWELDSRAWHGDDRSRAADLRRQRDIEATGWLVNRFDNASLDRDPDGFVTAVEAVVTDRRTR